jgi:hypothetical protein
MGCSLISKRAILPVFGQDNKAINVLQHFRCTVAAKLGTPLRIVAVLQTHDSLSPLLCCRPRNYSDGDVTTDGCPGAVCQSCCVW